jgi:hypothetical protein
VPVWCQLWARRRSLLDLAKRLALQLGEELAHVFPLSAAALARIKLGPWKVYSDEELQQIANGGIDADAEYWLPRCCYGHVAHESTASGAGSQMPKQVLALAKQAVHDALTFEGEHIEHAEHDEVGSFRAALHAGAGLQALEVATAQLVEYAQLAVEHVTASERREASHDLWPPRRRDHAASGPDGTRPS